MTRSRKLLALAATAMVLAAASFLGFFFFRDNFATHYGIKAISAQAFRAGEIPWWNPADGGGQPIAGNPNALTFYPDNVLYLFLPLHVAFNLHFLLHWLAAWFAMRALTRSSWAAWMYALSGVVVSSMAFYNLSTAIALIPFALWAVERRKPLQLGCAFGLLALAGEPVTMLSAGMAAAILAPGLLRLRDLASSIVVALIVASPQLIAYGEIASEVERSRGFSATTVLNASLAPQRLLEMLVPFLRMDDGPRLFLSLFIGVIAVAALAQRSRYVVIAIAAIFLSLGRFNPLVRWPVEAFASLRIARFPEKFALIATIALVVLSAGLLERSRAWRWATLLPLALVAVVTVPIDWFAPYDVPAQPPLRTAANALPGGQVPSRPEYRHRATLLEPLFGIAAGRSYVLNRSGDGMHSLRSRVAAERFVSTGAEVRLRYLQIAGANVADALPPVMVVRDVIAAPGITEMVHLLEESPIDFRTTALAPVFQSGPVSPGEARIVHFTNTGQSIDIDVTSPGPFLLFVNQSYFGAWDARIGTASLRTIPLDLDRLGVFAPAGSSHITLRFGRHRSLVAVAWAASLLLLVAAGFALRIEKLDGGSGQV